MRWNFPPQKICPYRKEQSELSSVITGCQDFDQHLILHLLIWLVGKVLTN